MKFKHKMNYANKVKINNVAIIGEDEEKENKVSIKLMNSGKQISLPFEDIIHFIEENRRVEKIFKLE